MLVCGKCDWWLLWYKPLNKRDIPALGLAACCGGCRLRGERVRLPRPAPGQTRGQCSRVNSRPRLLIALTFHSRSSWFSVRMLFPKYSLSSLAAHKYIEVLFCWAFSPPESSIAQSAKWCAGRGRAARNSLTVLWCKENPVSPLIISPLAVTGEWEMEISGKIRLGQDESATVVTFLVPSD